MTVLPGGKAPSLSPPIPAAACRESLGLTILLIWLNLQVLSVR